jgi:hypothetical protein
MAAALSCNGIAFRIEAIQGTTAKPSVFDETAAPHALLVSDSAAG